MRKRRRIPERCTILRVTPVTESSGSRVAEISSSFCVVVVVSRFCVGACFYSAAFHFPSPAGCGNSQGGEIGRVSYNRFAVCLHLSKEQPQNIPFRRRAVPFLTRRSSPASKRRVYHVTEHRHLHARGFFFDFAHTIYIHIINIVNMC